MSLILRELRAGDEPALFEAYESFKDPHFTFALDYDPAQPFDAYLAKRAKMKLGVELKKDWVPSTLLFGFVNDSIAGRLSLRHSLNAYLATVGGHIGYGVVPRYRRRGYATEMLRQSLPLARQVGLQKVLLTCDEGNIGSIKTIEACGGQFESFYADPDLGIRKMRYWIELE